MPNAINQIAIVLPAYNEEKDLPALLDNIREQVSSMPFGYTVVVVDDGSKDRTAAICEDKAREMPLKLVRHQVNKGLGEGLADRPACQAGSSAMLGGRHGRGQHAQSRSHPRDGGDHPCQRSLGCRHRLALSAKAASCRACPSSAR
jgi:cellulose synthase/poly-beta-1,6-N-acetylglucosamine synthase-like glycosyltransferase